MEGRALLAWRGAGLKKHSVSRPSRSPPVPGRTFLAAPQGTRFLTGLPLPCAPLPASPSALRRLRPRPGVTRAALPPSHLTGVLEGFVGGKGSLKPLELLGDVGTRVPAPRTMAWGPASQPLGTRVLALWTVVWEPVSPLWTEVWAPGSWPRGLWSGRPADL